MPPASRLTARPAASKRDADPRLIDRTKGGLTSKRPVVCDGKGRPVRLLLSEGPCSDFTGAELLLRDLPEANVLIGDKGYDNPNSGQGDQGKRGGGPTVHGESASSGVPVIQNRGCTTPFPSWMGRRAGMASCHTPRSPPPPPPAASAWTRGEHLVWLAPAVMGGCLCRDGRRGARQRGCAFSWSLVRNWADPAF